MSNPFMFKELQQLIVVEIFDIISPEPLNIYFKLSLNGQTDFLESWLPQSYTSFDITSRICCGHQYILRTIYNRLYPYVVRFPRCHSVFISICVEELRTSHLSAYFLEVVLILFTYLYMYPITCFRWKLTVTL